LRITGSPDISAAAEQIDDVERRTTAVKRTGSEEHEHTVKSR
jgi:hypothetical protein